MNLAIDRDWRVLASAALIVAGALLAIVTLAAQLEGNHTVVAVWVAILAVFSIPGWITLPRWRQLGGLPLGALLASAAASVLAGLALYESSTAGPVLAQWWTSLIILALIVSAATMLAIPSVTTAALRRVRFASAAVMLAVYAPALLIIWRPFENGAWVRSVLGAFATLGVALLLAFVLLLSWERSTSRALCSHCGQPIA